MIVDETTNTVMGEIAHIEGVGKHSARHIPNLPAERLNDIARASFQRNSWMFGASRASLNEPSCTVRRETKLGQDPNPVDVSEWIQQFTIAP